MIDIDVYMEVARVKQTVKNQNLVTKDILLFKHYKILYVLVQRYMDILKLVEQATEVV